MIIDTHCHIQDFGNRASQVWARAVDSGVNRGIVVGTSLKDCIAARKVARELEGLYFAGGLHPVDAGRFAEQWEPIANMCSSEECIAIGETGLDFFKGPETTMQIASLEEHLLLAARLGKPIILHVRPSGRDLASVCHVHDVLFSILRKHSDVICVLHCFAGTASHARQAIEMGHYVSFAGTLTFTNETGKMLSDAAKSIAPDRILVETDAPYVRPIGCPSKRNEPSYIRFTLARLAGIRGWSFNEAAWQTTLNAECFFNL